MKLKINNTVKEFDAESLTVADLMESLGHSAEGTAVALGTEFVQRADYQSKQLHDGDELLIIGAAYGG